MRLLILFLICCLILGCAQEKVPMGVVKADPDNDGLTNEEEQRYGTNPQNPDTDNDGLKDGDEVNVYGTSPVDFDTDGDGLGDGEEVTKYGTDPKDLDTDNDGLEDGYEVMSSRTNPKKVDTDGDTLSDKDELERYYTNPNEADSDGDKLDDYEEIVSYGTDPLKADTDDDGLNDYREVELGTNPKNPDSDRDGYEDGIDLWPLENKGIQIDVLYYKVENADFLFDLSDPYLVAYVNHERHETYYYNNVQEKRNPWTLTIDTPDNTRSVYIEIYLIDEDDTWDPDDPDDTIDIYGGSVARYWIEVDYEIDSEAITIHEDGSKDGASEVDGIIELQISTTTLSTYEVFG